MTFTEKIFLLEYLSAAQIKDVENKIKTIEELLDERALEHFKALQRYTRLQSSMIRTVKDRG